MGTGIAFVFNKNSSKFVNIYDISDTSLINSKKFIDKLLEKEIQKGKLDKDSKEQILSRFTFTKNLNDLKESALIVEAVVENLGVKLELFGRLDQITNKQTILASNTSSISITKLCAGVSVPGRIIGMHFMNPVPVMKLVEVIRGLQTSTETFEKTIGFVKDLGKESVVSEDRPGFIINRILMPMINEAVFCLQEGIANKEDIDKGMILGTSVPMGPLTLADFIGLDTCLYIMEVLYGELKDSKYRPCPLLANYVHAGWLGRKTGKGFYEYPSNPNLAK